MFEKIIAHKTVIFLVFIFVIVIISAVLQMISGSGNEGKDTVGPSPTAVFVQHSGPALGDEFPPFTGERDAPVPTTLQYVNSAYDLRAKLPYSQSEFSIVYDYKRLVFVVIVQTPAEKNKAVFDGWLKTNGFSSIPQDQFVIN